MPVLELPRDQIPLPHRKARQRRSFAERIDRNVARMPGEKPLVPVLMHTFERILADVPDLTDLERIVVRGLERHPELERDRIAGWVEAWHRVPPELKARISPPEFNALSMERGVGLAELQRSVVRDAHRPPRRTAPVEWAKLEAFTIRTDVLLGPPAHVQDTAEHGLDGVNVAQLGQVFHIRGYGFGTSNDANTIVITPEGRDEPAFVSHPIASAPDVLQCVAPAPGTTQPGAYSLQVVVRAHRASNVITVHLTQPPAAAGTIAAVTPATQHPGKAIRLNVSGMAGSPRVWWQPVAPGTLPYSSAGVVVAPGAIDSVVPVELVRAPGDYFVSAGGVNQKLSNKVRVTVAPYAYSVTFDAMTCVDESDPEWAGDDEIVTHWGLAVDGSIYTKGSAEYEGFSDGVVRPYGPLDRRVFREDGPGAVRESLTLATKLWEWDAGDAEAWGTTLQAVSSVVSEIPVVGQVLSVLVSLLGWLISLFGGDPDWLGTHTDTWSAEELLALTGPAGRATLVAWFNNDDDTGSYRVAYAIDRSPI